MTIIAGFKTKEGVVLCADTQETVGHISKRNVPKLRFEPRDHPMLGVHGHNSDEVAAAFCGAGSGPFIDKLVDNAWQAAQGCTTLDEVCGGIEASIKNLYTEFGEIYQQGSCPEVELIYAVKMSGQTKLFSAFGPVVTERDEYSSGGIGYYMADFLKQKMYKRYLTLHQCVILAAYILHQAMEHVEGCGGEGHIAVLRNEGVSGRVASNRVDGITQLLGLIDDKVSSILLDAANLEYDDAAFQRYLQSSSDVVSAIRNAKKNELDQARMTFTSIRQILAGDNYQPPSLDEFGLPRPLDDQTKSE